MMQKQTLTNSLMDKIKDAHWAIEKQTFHIALCEEFPSEISKW